MPKCYFNKVAKQLWVKNKQFKFMVNLIRYSNKTIGRIKTRQK